MYGTGNVRPCWVWCFCREGAGSVAELIERGMVESSLLTEFPVISFSMPGYGAKLRDVFRMPVEETPFLWGFMKGIQVQPASSPSYEGASAIVYDPKLLMVVDSARATSIGIMVGEATRVGVSVVRGPRALPKLGRLQRIGRGLRESTMAGRGRGGRSGSVHGNLGVLGIDPHA